MSTRILHDAESDSACLYDSVTETAFGRVLHGDEDKDVDASEVAKAFLDWYGEHGKERDPRLETNIGKVQDDWLMLYNEGEG